MIVIEQLKKEYLQTAPLGLSVSDIALDMKNGKKLTKQQGGENDD